MIDYLQKLRLDDKTAFVVGGLGLIGKEVSIAIASAGAKIIVLDINNKHAQTFESKSRDKDCKVICRNFDCSDMEQLGEKFNALILIWWK